MVTIRAGAGLEGGGAGTAGSAFASEGGGEAVSARGATRGPEGDEAAAGGADADRPDAGGMGAGGADEGGADDRSAVDAGEGVKCTDRAMTIAIPSAASTMRATPHQTRPRRSTRAAAGRQPGRGRDMAGAGVGSTVAEEPASDWTTVA